MSDELVGSRSSDRKNESPNDNGLRSDIPSGPEALGIGNGPDTESASAHSSSPDGSNDVNVLGGSPPPEGDTTSGLESKPPEVSDEKEETPSGLRRKLTNWGPIRRWSWYRRMRGEALKEPTFWRQRDPNENARGRLPDSERVELPAIWVAELYTPSTVPGLLAGITDLGWEYGRTRDEDLSKWMNDVREGRRAGWTNLGLVSPPESPDIMQERTAPLPGGVDATLPVLMSLTPSITALVVAFLMSDESASALDAPLRAYYKTHVEKDPLFRRRHIIPYVLWGKRARFGRRIYSPVHARGQAVRASLRELEQDCTGWVRDKLPGVFASGLRSAQLPTAVLLVTEVAAPLTDEARSTRAFEGLAIDRDYDAWESTGWPRGRLVLPRTWDDEGSRLVFACRRRDAFPEQSGYPEPTSNRTIAHRANELVRGLLSRWALTCMLDGYHELLSTLRDKSARESSHRPVRDLTTLRSLTRTHMYDISTSAQELEDFAQEDRSYRYDVLEMEYVGSVRGERPDLLQSLQSSQVNRARQLRRDSTLLQSTLSIISEVTQTISNMRVQRFVLFLTFVSISIALTALIITLSSPP
jgi:hypothetical protein